jgi:Zn finger protein HypA/HybF involved in hydrogenase expression
MIVSKEVVVRPNNHSINHYLDKGYNAICRKDLLIRVEDLTNSSRIRVDCKCEKCNKIVNLKYQDYYKSKSKYNFYVCDDCKYEKIKITNKNKYGNEKYVNIKKVKETMNLVYGCDYPLQNKKIKNKKEDTCLKKYGFKNASENSDIKQKISISNIELFRDEKIKSEIINKRKVKCVEKYGVDSFTKTEEYRLKSEKTCLKRYNFKHNGSVPEFILKRKQSRLKKNNVERSDFYLYRKIVSNITRKNFKKLLEDWNGYDYYDNEYIANNFNYKSSDRLYPSIDHKISTYYGFINKISPEIIGDINNLCFTKRSINSSKKDKTEEQYRI